MAKEYAMSNDELIAAFKALEEYEDKSPWVMVMQPEDYADWQAMLRVARAAQYLRTPDESMGDIRAGEKLDEALKEVEDLLPIGDFLT